MKVFVLAGGHGERMRPWSSLIPKALLPVAGVPCVRRIVNNLIAEGFQEVDIILCINNWAKSYFKHEFRDLDIAFSITETPKGTAGEVFNALSMWDKLDQFMIVYGDDLTKISYADFIAQHNAQVKIKGVSGSLALTTKVPLEYGVVDIQDSVVIAFREKPFLENTIWTGRAIFQTGKVFKYLGNHVDFAKKVFPAMIEDDKESLHAYVEDEIWVDIGNLAHFTRANKLAKEGYFD